MAADLGFLARSGWGIGAPIASWGYGGSGYLWLGLPGSARIEGVELFLARLSATASRAELGSAAARVRLATRAARVELTSEHATAQTETKAARAETEAVAPFGARLSVVGAKAEIEGRCAVAEICTKALYRAEVSSVLLWHAESKEEPANG